MRAQILALVILLGELTISALAVFHPRVDASYAAFYIAHTSLCWLPAAQRPAALAALRAQTLTISQLPPDAACTLLAAGWSHPEPWGVWSLGRTTALTLPAPPSAKTLTLTLLAYTTRHVQPVTIALDNQTIETVLIPAGAIAHVTLPLPATLPPILRLTFHIKHPAMPKNSTDTRELGIGLINLNWQ